MTRAEWRSFLTFLGVGLLVMVDVAMFILLMYIGIHFVNKYW